MKLILDKADLRKILEDHFGGGVISDTDIEWRTDPELEVVIRNIPAPQSAKHLEAPQEKATEEPVRSGKRTGHDEDEWLRSARSDAHVLRNPPVTDDPTAVEDQAAFDALRKVSEDLAERGQPLSPLKPVKPWTRPTADEEG